VTAARLDSVRRRLDYLEGTTPRVGGFVLHQVDQDFLTRDDIGDKHNLALKTSYAVAAVGHACDLDSEAVHARIAAKIVEPDDIAATAAVDAVQLICGGA
jgi:hypothetical protein